MKPEIFKILIISMFCINCFIGFFSIETSTQAKNIIRSETAPVITIIYPYNCQYLPPSVKEVEITITTDIDAECQYSNSDFQFGTGINFNTSFDRRFHSFRLYNLTSESTYEFYYKGKDWNTGKVNDQAVIHIFKIYNESDNLKTITNSVRVSSSHPGKELKFLLDNDPKTEFSTDKELLLNTSNTFELTFKLPNKGSFDISKRQVSYFRFRGSNLGTCPDNYDILANNKMILNNCRITPDNVNSWVVVDLPDTYLTNFKMVVKSVQGAGKQKVMISDLEIFSTEKEHYMNPVPNNGFLGITNWWNNLQWAYSLHIDDVDDVELTVKKFGSVMPLTLQIWREFPTDFGNITRIIESGHEYGSHGNSHTNSKGFSYFDAYTWLNDSKNYIERNVYQTSRWSDNTVLSFAYPYSSSNFHVSEAAYDVGFRISGQVNSEDNLDTSWRSCSGGIIYPRDEKDWMQISRPLGAVKDDVAQFSDGSFEQKWNLIRDGGYFGDSMLHQDETMHIKYKNYVKNDKVGWQCTWGEVRTYYYLTQHTQVIFNQEASTKDKMVYDIIVTEDGHLSHWKVPVTYLFDLNITKFDKNELQVFLEKSLNLKNIEGVQRMCEGYYFKDNLLYLSIARSNGEQITLNNLILPTIIDVFPNNYAQDVELTESIKVIFNKPIDTSSLIFKCQPDPGDWSIDWSDYYRTATFYHTPFKSQTQYEFEIETCRDLLHNPLLPGIIPNPWTFTTIDVDPPFIVSVIPSNGSIDVLPDTIITLEFNEPMDTATFRLNCTPDPGGWQQFWREDNKVLDMTHNSFQSSTLYNIKIIDVKDMAGNNLSIEPLKNIIIYQIKDIIAPQIESIYPGNNDFNISIHEKICIKFSEPMDIKSLNFSCNPDPKGWSFTWVDNNSKMYMEHNDFKRSTKYNIDIIDCKDLSGISLIYQDGFNNLNFTTIENFKPIIISTPKFYANVNELYIYQVVSKDKDNDKIKYKLTILPEGMYMDPQTGLITWTPTIRQIGKNPVELQITDGYDLAIQNFEIQVNITEPVTPDDGTGDHSNIENDTDRENDPFDYSPGTMICGVLPFIVFTLLFFALVYSKTPK